MSNMETVDGINHAWNVDQYVLVWDAVLGLKLASFHPELCHTYSKFTMEVFDTEAEITTRVEALGFEMPEV